MGVLILATIREDDKDWSSRESSATRRSFRGRREEVGEMEQIEGAARGVEQRW